MKLTTIALATALRFRAPSHLHKRAARRLAQVPRQAAPQLAVPRLARRGTAARQELAALQQPLRITLKARQEIPSAPKPRLAGRPWRHPAPAPA